MMKKLSRVKCFVSGGDRISVQELVSMEQLFETPIVNGYGNNELTGAAGGKYVFPVTLVARQTTKNERE